MTGTHTLFPPGILKKLGFRPASACIRSGRIPFLVPLYVGGNKLIRLKLTLPCPLANSMTKLLFTLGAANLGSRMNLCSVQLVLEQPDWISEDAKTVEVRSDLSLTVNFPL